MFCKCLLNNMVRFIVSDKGTRMLDSLSVLIAGRKVMQAESSCVIVNGWMLNSIYYKVDVTQVKIPV